MSGFGTQKTEKKPFLSKPETASHAKRHRMNSAASLAQPAVLLQRALGNRFLTSRANLSNTQKKVQAKLRVGSPNDVFEQEADRVANQVMRMPFPQGLDDKSRKHQGPVISRYVESSSPPAVSRQTNEREEEEQSFSESNLLSTKENPGAQPQLTDQTATEVQSLRGGGLPLSSDLRTFFEPRFNHDFSHVRIHTSARAEQSARSLNARAYTLGNDLAFASGEYQPHSDAGRRLIAHELTHVIQQKGQVQRIMRVCNCAAIGASDPTAAQKTRLSGPFPNLVDGNWCVTAPASSTYNCIAWSIGDTSSWIWNEVDSIYGDNDGTVSLSDFDALYAMEGLTPVTDQTPSDPKVVLYSKGNKPTHAARKSTAPCGFAFESKLGGYIRIVHTDQELEGGSVYGDINRYYV